ncbi:pilus assembly protein [Aromatoleum toluvorans]|uniref:Pilus assembly protein n=1 Tax=Aromatoleum toluvorans TaxID=92002 RepID=A0ABX1Q2B0_9RHOO|nr:PilC/PilY family type IV pilus protein [Aromatoleum toluvorans]NMG45793.1 pilus assembly protein [Aromatoleum toluvorans]
MNRLSRLAVALACLGIGTGTSTWAEDIDIYTQTTTGSAPNVLLFVDNSSNWSAANQAWNKASVTTKCKGDATCLDYVTKVFGTASDLVQGQVEIRALKVVLQELACGTSSPFRINVGLMLYNTANTVDSPSDVSGYIRRRIVPLAPASAGCTDLIRDLNAIDAEVTDPNFKAPSSTNYGSSLFEAFKYFGGYANTNNVAATVMGSPAGARGFGPTRYSKKNDLEDPLAFTDPVAREQYASPIGADSCGKNYIVLIGNQFPNQEFGTDQNATPPTNSVMRYLGLAPKQLYAVANKSDIRFADEWTQFLARTDVSAVSDQQPVKTFTINVYNKSEDTKQTALLNSMAYYGGSGVGGAFKVDGDLGALVSAFRNIFTQIAAVNSAFASASLPISVNTQGTYLNQVFIGMFRPDANKRPRWAGNLKQYQFQLRETKVGDVIRRSLFLADAGKNPAIDNANTGFLQTCARSFWTTDSGTYWQSVTEPTTPDHRIPKGSCTGFELNDSPDGSIVERGGAAQKLRNMTPSDRLIRTCAAAPANCDSLTSFDVSTDVDKQWIRGDNVGDGYNTATITDNNEKYDWLGTLTPKAVRPTVHGGIIHSRPLAINYGAAGTDDVVVYYGGDDGLLRAIDGNKDETKARSGQELWSFLPPEFVGRLKRNRADYPLVSFFDNPTPPLGESPKDYFFDGSLGAYVGPAKADGTGSQVKLLYASMRRGGRMIYAFDATKHPGATGGAPTPIWRFGCPTSANTDCHGDAGVTKIGQTWSAPKIVRVKGQSSLYAVFGAGYDACEDTEPRNCGSATTGKGIFVLDAKSGALLRFIDLGTGAGHVAADVVPIDTNSDGFSDVIYAADTQGNVWRVNLTDPADPSTQDQSNWKVTHVAKIADWSVSQRSRKFLFAPDVVTIGNFNIVLIGSGNREKPLDTSTAAKVKNRFYGFWDEYALVSGFVTIDDSSDCDAAGDTVLTSSSCQLMNTTDVTKDYLPVFSSVATRPRGWVIDLEHTTTLGITEQVVTTPATVGGLVNFSTFQAVNPDKCSALGTARGYAACFLHGGASCGAPAPEGTNRSEAFVGGGLAPSPVAGVVEVDGKIVPFIIGGKPDAPGGSPLEAKLPSIPIKKNRVKVYRYKKID